MKNESNFNDYQSIFSEDKNLSDYVEINIKSLINIETLINDILDNHESLRIINSSLDKRYNREYPISIVNLYNKLLFALKTNEVNAVIDKLPKTEIFIKLDKYISSIFKILQYLDEIRKNDNVVKINYLNIILDIELLLICSLMEKTLTTLFPSKDYRKGKHLIEIEYNKMNKDREKYLSKTNDYFIDYIDGIKNIMKALELSSIEIESYLKANTKKIEKQTNNKIISNFKFKKGISTVNKSKVLYPLICLMSDILHDKKLPLDDNEFSEGNYNAFTFSEYQRSEFRKFKGVK